LDLGEEPGRIVRLPSFLIVSSDCSFRFSSDDSKSEDGVEHCDRTVRNSLSAATDTSAGPRDMAAQAASSLIHAGSSRETPGRTSTSMTSVPLRPLRRTTGNFCPWSGCHGYAMITMPNRYVECRLIPSLIQKDKPVARSRFLPQHRLHPHIQTVETLAHVHRGQRHKNPGGGR